ncbi:MAG: carbohydrate kinase family protein [Candidatus Ranarchaeia archaeon]
MYDLVTIGNPVYDYIKTPYLNTDNRVLSGCSTNAALVAKQLGIKKVALIGSIGSDQKKKFENDLNKYQIESSSLIIGKETGGFSLIYQEDGSRTLDILGIADPITPKNIPDKVLNTKAILLGPVLQEIDLELIRYISETSKAKLYLDPQGMIRKIGEDGRIIRICDRKIMKEVAKHIYFFKPNEYESVEITGEKDPVKSVITINEWGAEIAAVTLAHRGSVVYSENIQSDEIYLIPAFSTTAKDPTGAGDTYAGSFISATLLNNGNLSQNALFASAAASIKVEQTGPDFKVPIAEVKKRVNTIKGNMKVVDKSKI